MFETHRESPRWKDNKKEINSTMTQDIRLDNMQDILLIIPPNLISNRKYASDEGYPKAKNLPGEDLLDSFSENYHRRNGDKKSGGYSSTSERKTQTEIINKSVNISTL